MWRSEPPPDLQVLDVTRVAHRIQRKATASDEVLLVRSVVEVQHRSVGIGAAAPRGREGPLRAAVLQVHEAPASRLVGGVFHIGGRPCHLAPMRALTLFLFDLINQCQFTNSARRKSKMLTATSVDSEQRATYRLSAGHVAAGNEFTAWFRLSKLPFRSSTAVSMLHMRPRSFSSTNDTVESSCGPALHQMLRTDSTRSLGRHRSRTVRTPGAGLSPRPPKVSIR